MSSPSLSVIIPAYNAAPYIKQCVDSVLRQTFQDYELIIIDDGSTDDTGIILDELYGTDDRVIIRHQINRGLYATRRIGLSLASGEYVGWVDADDYIDAEMYETLYDAAIRFDSDLVFCDYSWFPDKPKNKEKWFRPYNGIRNVDFLERNSQPWNKIVRRELLERLQIGENFESCFDEIYIRVLLHANNPVAIDQQLYHYRIIENSMSNSYSNIDHYKRFVEASINLRELMLNETENDEYWRSYFDYRIAYYLLTTLIVSAKVGNKAEYSKAMRQLKGMSPSYKTNMHYHAILFSNFGKLKGFVVGDIVPMGFIPARIACMIGMRQ